jgi:outer membrane protein TolC
LLRELETQRLKAETQVSTATRIAANTPVAMKAAREARAQAEARYRAGLTSITDLADAERALTAAEIDDGLARLNVWRAQLALAVAGGDLTNYLDVAERP